MPNYKRMYMKLFSAITDAIDALEHNNFGCAHEILVESQMSAEEMYINSHDKDTD